MRDPIHGPERPAVKAGGGKREGGDDDGIAEDVAEGPPRVLDPAMRGNGGPDVADLERRWHPGPQVGRLVLFFGGDSGWRDLPGEGDDPGPRQ